MKPDLQLENPGHCTIASYPLIHVAVLTTTTLSLLFSCTSVSQGGFHAKDILNRLFLYTPIQKENNNILQTVAWNQLCSHQE